MYSYIFDKLKNVLELTKKYKKKFRIRVSVIVIKNGKILVAYNPFSDKSKYFIPGGGVKENIKESAAREVLEEIGVKIEKLKIIPKLLIYFFPDIDIDNEEYIGIINLFYYGKYLEEDYNIKSEYGYLELDPEEAIEKLRYTKNKLDDISELWIRTLINKEIESIKYLMEESKISNISIFNLDEKKIKDEELKKNKYEYFDTDFFQYRLRIVKKKDKKNDNIIKKIDWLKKVYDKILDLSYNIYKKKIPNTKVNKEEYKSYIEPRILSFYDSNNDNKIMFILYLPLKEVFDKYIIIFISGENLKDMLIVDKNNFKKEK